MDSKIEVVTSPTDGTGALRLGADSASYVLARDLNIGYSNEVVVGDISFELRQGQAMALIGTNGSGKSTLLKTIVGLLPSLGGQLSVFGMAPGNNLRRIAYLGQFHASGFVLPIRAVDVVRMGRFPLYGLLRRMSRRDDEIVFSAMRTMGIEKLANSPLRSLSGGQQQRTYLAQVLAHQADLLVLDEPTAGLDAGGRDLYLHAMNDELCRGASVIMATHDIQEEAALCHQVMLLARKVVAIGAPQDVLAPQALLDTFGIVITGEKRLHVLETKHGHDDVERFDLNKPGH
ncbi:MAG TPA: ATP-binding cassette domain-containing protein [Dehalococcoidia bacterium]|nr:ATP-binding cassette domain-containing protein [Dehalococcoidia bacterium]